MADSTIRMDLQVGTYVDVELEIEVNWSLNTIGEVDINDFYAYHVEVDANDHRAHERVPYWMHKIIKVELEEYHEDIINKMD